MTAEFDDVTTWEVVLVRCPECNETTVRDGAERHQARHWLWSIGDYMDDDKVLVKTRGEADAMYVGNGRAIFFRDNKMRWVGMERPRT